MASGAVVSDLAAFEDAVRANTRSLYGLALSVLSDSQEAEDAVQDTMAIAWGHWRSVRDEDRRHAWLKQICLRRTCGPSRSSPVVCRRCRGHGS